MRTSLIGNDPSRPGGLGAWDWEGAVRGLGTFLEYKKIESLFISIGETSEYMYRQHNLTCEYLETITPYHVRFLSTSQIGRISWQFF